MHIFYNSELPFIIYTYVNVVIVYTCGLLPTALLSGRPFSEVIEFPPRDQEVWGSSPGGTLGIFYTLIYFNGDEVFDKLMR